MWLFLLTIFPIVMDCKRHGSVKASCPSSAPKEYAGCRTHGLRCEYNNGCCCGKCEYAQTFVCSNRRWKLSSGKKCPPCPKVCKCPKTGKPVCGVNGKSYANSCLAKCDGVETKCSGKCPCEKPCLCTTEYKPVCGVDGKSYSNSCRAKCEGVEPKCSGQCPCKKPCPCPKLYKPVCGADGTSYSNSCLAKCAGVKTNCDGKCPCKKKSEKKSEKKGKKNGRHRG